ncbi:hypothetical protein SRDD_41090 [Serratia sp. DD3]|nr:hypothetical protein SRDD_41090 [Serratia sp. DD3]
MPILGIHAHPGQPAVTVMHKPVIRRRVIRRYQPVEVTTQHHRRQARQPTTGADELHAPLVNFTTQQRLILVTLRGHT